MQFLDLSFVPDSFEKIVPGIAPWVESLKTLPIAVVIQNLFAPIEVFHILGLFMLGGATILTCLRLIGVGLVEEPASVIEKQTRPWLTFGVLMAIISGLIIGLSNAEKLYNNSAFLFKMLAMVAGVVFTYFVMIPVAKRNGQVSGGAKIGLLVGMLIWLAGIVVMLVKPGSNVGVFHVLFAGSLVAGFVLAGRSRVIYLIGLGLIVAAWQIITHTAITVNGDIDKFDTTNKSFMLASAVWIFGAILLNIFGKAGRGDGSGLAKLVGYATILVWVTVGAGGRWIGLT